MKKYILISIVCMAIICNVLSKTFVYVDHKAYIYKFKQNNKEYTIVFQDVYGTKLNVIVDSSQYYELAKETNRKKYYHVRQYDDGKMKILKF